MADRHETVLQRRFVRAMKKLQAEISINDLGVMLASGHGKVVDKVLIPRKKIEDVLEPMKDVVKKAVIAGGRLGAAHVMEVLNR